MPCLVPRNRGPAPTSPGSGPPGRASYDESPACDGSRRLFSAVPHVDLIRSGKTLAAIPAPTRQCRGAGASTILLPQSRLWMGKARQGFGIPTLDQHLGGGLIPGTLTVVAGATGAGKTQLG